MSVHSGSIPAAQVSLSILVPLLQNKIKTFGHGASSCREWLRFLSYRCHGHDCQRSHGDVVATVRYRAIALLSLDQIFNAGLDGLVNFVGNIKACRRVCLVRRTLPPAGLAHGRRSKSQQPFTARWNIGSVIHFDHGFTLTFPLHALRWHGSRLRFRACTVVQCFLHGSRMHPQCGAL